MAEIFKAFDYTVSLSDPYGYGAYTTLCIRDSGVSFHTDFCKRDTLKDIAEKMEYTAQKLKARHKELCLEAGIPDEENDILGGNHAS